ncbi:MAG: hypothetical protein LUH02_06605 [Erysipelotrichaceae bacterium]|nr:hypothetical protein [Erysipelotrichaceae bacterium]
MEFIFQPEVRDLGVKCIGVEIDGVDNQTISQEYLDYRKNTIETLLNQYQGYDIKHDDIIEGFYQLHEKVHVKRRKNPPASENLVKSLLKHGDLPTINKIVDIYNLLSVKTKLSLGAHDIDHVTGNIHLRLTHGDETFIPLGQNEPIPVQQDEYSYIDDDNEIICRLEIRQVNKTKVTEDTKNVFFIVQGNKKTSNEYVLEVANELIDLVTKYAGGTGKILNTL